MATPLDSYHALLWGAEQSNSASKIYSIKDPGCECDFCDKQAIEKIIDPVGNIDLSLCAHCCYKLEPVEEYKCYNCNEFEAFYDARGLCYYCYVATPGP